MEDKTTTTTTKNLTHTHVCSHYPSPHLLSSFLPKRGKQIAGKQTRWKKKQVKREIKWARCEWRNGERIKKKGRKIPVEAKQCLQAAAGSYISQLNLNQTEMYSSRNQCPNQDEKLQHTALKGCGRGVSSGWNRQKKQQKKRQEREKGRRIDFSSFCHHSFDASRPMKSYDCDRNKNNH